MIGRLFKKKWILCAAIIGCFVCSFSQEVYAGDYSGKVNGKVYEFGKKDHYDFTTAESENQADENNTLGLFVLDGIMTEDEEKDGVPSFSVSGGSVSMTYSYTDALRNAPEEEWHLCDDETKTVADVKLKSKIQKGAIIVQTSKDGQTWINDVMLTDTFAETQEQAEPLYTTKIVQLSNGCYYRVIIAYQTRIKTGQNQVLFLKRDQFDYKKYAEVYEFYLHDAAKNETAANTETKALGDLVRAEKENSGYAGNKAIGIKDPHYGWTIGQFFVSGYTRAAKDDEGDPVFLKTVGDQITLWFQLQQDIDKLNQNGTLSIADDKKGYDQYFQTEKTDMGRGTLIIRYTDEEGVKHEPEIYTNFLEANATTSADTIVRLFEEGDYEVALDYKVKSVLRKVASIEVVPEYSDYRIAFSFSVRNGNCMVYPFDVKTGAELSDEAITPNGFKLDMAKSKYLTIDVKYARVSQGANGYVEDVRFNRPAQDGDEYTDEGIYTFSVRNLYTGESTTKRVYVGDADYLIALSANNLSVPDLNEKLAAGAVLQSNGALEEPVATDDNSAEVSEGAAALIVQKEQIASQEGQEESEHSIETTNVKKAKPSGVMILVGGVACLIAVFAAILAAAKRRRAKAAQTIKDGDGT